jgi:hypothetical protein
MSMIRTLVPRRPDADVVLVHSARTPGDSLFREELAELADQFPNFRLAHWFTGEQGRMDLTNTDQLDEICPDWKERAAYACGPDSFLDDAEALWKRPQRWTSQRRRPATDVARPDPVNLIIERFNTSLLKAASGTTAAWSPLRPPTGRWKPTATHPFWTWAKTPGSSCPAAAAWASATAACTPLLQGRSGTSAPGKSTVNPAN